MNQTNSNQITDDVPTFNQMVILIDNFDPAMVAIAIILLLFFFVTSIITIYQYLVKSKDVILDRLFGKQIPNKQIKKYGFIDRYQENSTHPDICSICYSEYQLDDQLFTLTCGHSYHYQCILEWFNRCDNKIICPYCNSTGNLVINPLTRLSLIPNTSDFSGSLL